MQLLSKSDYIKKYNVSAKTFYNRIDAGKLIPRQLPGTNELHVIDDINTGITLNPADIDKLLKSFKAEFEEMILDASEKNVPAKDVFNEIEKKQQWLEAHGVKRICGFRFRSIYNKIAAFQIKKASGLELKLKRKVHKNAGTVYNRVLKNEHLQNLILPELCNFYVTNGTYESKDRVSSARLAVDLLIKYAQDLTNKGDDTFIEMLIPAVRQAAYRWFLKKVNQMGLKQITVLANHAGKWRNRYEVKNKGAFTDDINFNDYWMMDDHEIHISGGLEWDETLKEMKLQTLKLWTLIEAFTMKPLAYVIKTGELTSEDVINVLIQAFSKYGLPKRGILYDNGRITTAEKVHSFVMDVIRHPGTRELTKTCMLDFNPCRAYTPTDKSNIELFHSILERETSPFIQNFIAGKRENGRHTGYKLSPEECINTVDELKNYYITYLSENGFYQTRLRDRQIKQRGITISIQQHFNNCARDWKFTGIDGVTLRAAYSEKKLVTFSNQVKFKVNRVDQVFVPTEYISYIYNDRQFMALYHLNNLNEVCLYAVNRIQGTDINTGEVIRHEPGERVMTLTNLNYMSMDKRRELIARLNKQKRKAIKEGEKFIKMKANIENPLLTSLRVETDDAIVNGQKVIEKEARKIMDGALEDTAKTVYVKASEVMTDAAKPVYNDEDILKILADE